MAIEETVVTEAERLADMQPNPGHSDGEVISEPNGDKVAVVFDYDNNRNLIGWHKEPVGGSK